MYKEQQLKSLLQGRRILIAGYGREGQSTQALLQRLLPGQEATVAHNDEEIFSALEHNTYDLVIKSPGIPTMTLEGRCNLDTVTSQTDLFLQVYALQTLAVTGTKGKSTTTTLLHHLLKGSLPDRDVILAGNMGIPLFDILDQLDDQSLVVAEFSCHQLENIHCGPHIGIILNLYQEHLDHYHDYQGYQMAKLQLALRQHQGDHCLYCTDSPDLNSQFSVFNSQFRTTLHPYSLSDAKASPIAQWNTSLKGDHNLCNIYAAVQAAHLAVPEIPLTTLRSQLSTFKGLPHRLELVGTFNGISFYNDSISTIPEATIAALKALKKVDTLILGGFDRGIDYSPLGEYLRSHPSVRNLVFVGQAGRRMQQEWNLDDRTVLVEDDYSRIVPWCYSHTAQDGICLPSPAAASYDAFKNFEHRGTTFKDLVQSYSPNCGSHSSPKLGEVAQRAGGVCLSTLRRDLHAHPQTAGTEQYAHDLIVSHLQSLHPDKVYTHVGGYGVIAFWGKNPSVPAIAFRADTDALPTGHHCGHDGHTVILLRLAELIDSGLHGSTPILLVWQPAEETGQGARAILESGILQQYNIRAVYALHNLPGYPLGTVVLCPHTFAAASTGVVYRLQGRETHASTPELGINPGLAVSEIISKFNGFNGSGEKFRQSTLICVRVGEPAFGTSAGTAEVMFTLRAFSNDDMEHLLAEANAAVDEIAARHHLKVDRFLQDPFRATENCGDCVETIEKAAEEVPLRVRYQMEPNRWSEDFAEYLVYFPGAMFGIGSGENHPELHHPDYDFPDDLIEPAAQIFYSIIRENNNQ